MSIGFNRVNIRVSNNLVTFNGHYELFANGSIRYNGFEDQLISDSHDVKIKIENNRNPFSIRFHKWNRSYIFDVYSTGVFLHDPILRSLQYNDRNVILERNEVANLNQSAVQRQELESEINEREVANEDQSALDRQGLETEINEREVNENQSAIETSQSDTDDDDKFEDFPEVDFLNK